MPPGQDPARQSGLEGSATAVELSRPDLQAAASSPAVTRYVWRIAPIVSMTDDEVVELIGPAIQRYVDLMT